MTMARPDQGEGRYLSTTRRFDGGLRRPEQPVLPAVEDQWIGVLPGADLEHLADEDVVLPRLVLGVQPAVEVGQGAVEERRAAAGHSVRHFAERVAAAGAALGGDGSRRGLRAGAKAVTAT